MTVELCVIGGGRMGAALTVGLLRARRIDASSVCMAELDADRRRALAQMEALEGVRVEPGPLACDGALVAVKPAVAEQACRAAASAGCRRALSIMAGVPTARLEEWFGPGVPVVRAMPNTPALVGAGAAAIAGGREATAGDMDWAQGILESVGTVVRVPEAQLDAVTGLSGSGPAYVFLVAEAMIEAGMAAGLSAGVSRTLALATVAGAGRLLAETGLPPDELRAQVTSPGGTTEAGVGALEEHQVRAALVAAVAAATERSRQLGRPGQGSEG